MDDSGVKTASFFQNPKVVFGFILFLVIAGFGLGAYRFASGIRGGFVARHKVENTNLQPLVADSQENEALKQRDTDGDGLNDYEELYLYRTSPYLKDTDSDGLEDKVEIEKEKDPNCPEGKSCKQFVPPASEEVSEQSTVNSQQPLEIPGLDSETLNEQGGSNILELSGEASGDAGAISGTGQDTSLDLQNLTASEIRDLLLQSGKITQEQLDAIDDETLMRVYGEVLKTNNQ